MATGFTNDYGWIWRPHPGAHQRLQRLGAVSLRSVDVVSAVRLDVGWLRAVGLGAVSLRALGLLQRLLGRGARAASTTATAKLVAARARRVCRRTCFVRQYNICWYPLSTTSAIRIRGVIDIRIGIAGRIMLADVRLTRTAVLGAEGSGRRTRLAAAPAVAVVLVLDNRRRGLVITNRGVA